MNPDAEVTVELRWRGKCVRWCIPVAEHVWEESLAPLSRLHDCPLEYRAQEKAFRKKQMRHEIARTLASQLATAILKAAESQDPNMGYSPDEWEAIQGGSS